MAWRVAGIPEAIYDEWVTGAKAAIRAKYQTAICAFRAFADVQIEDRGRSALGLSQNALVHGLRGCGVPIREAWVLRLWDQLGPATGPMQVVEFRPFALVFRMDAGKQHQRRPAPARP